MSIAGILSSGLASLLQPANVQSSVPNKRAEFKQLGQDLQSGNLSAAQQDFATLTQSSSTQTFSVSQGASSGAAVSLKQSFSDLKSALASGDLSGAQQAYSQIQQDFQAQNAHGHHHHQGGAAPAQGQDTGTSNSATDLMRMLTGATNSNATSAYSSADLMALLSSSPGLDEAA